MKVFHFSVRQSHLAIRHASRIVGFWQSQERAMLDIRNLIRETEIHSTVYTDPAIFRLEMKHLFASAWLLVGHHSQIPVAGDYMLANIGDQPVFIVRDSENLIRAFFNRCPHRGARLKSAPSGNGSGIVCPYHGWSFHLNGKLRHVPAPEEYTLAHCATRDLEAVANVSLYRGFVFVNADRSSRESLLDFLGPMKDVIDDLVDRAPADDLEIAPALLRHRYRANWKLTFENLNDTIHAGVAHATAARIATSILEREPTAQTDAMLGLMAANSKPVKFFQKLRMTTSDRGHSYFEAHMPTAYEESVHREYFAALERARGKEAAERILSTRRHLGLLYPGSTWHARYQTVRIVQPLAPDLTEVVTMCFRLKGAPESTFSSAVSYSTGASSPLSSVITDDLEIYESIQRSAAGSSSWISIGRGSNIGVDNAADGTVPATSEGYIRGQYRVWAELVEGT